MVAPPEEMLEKIKNIQPEIEPLIKELIKGSNQANCPFKIMMKGDYDSQEMRIAVAKIARILYQNDLLNKLNLSLSEKSSFDTMIYAFGFWGGRTLFKHGNEICDCTEKCYRIRSS